MQKKTHNQFRIALIKQLIGKYKNNSSTGVNQTNPDIEEQETEQEQETIPGPRTINPVHQTELLHLPEYQEVEKGCCYCKQFKEKGTRYAQTRWRCQSCQDYYCLNGKRQCFTDYHQQNAATLGLRPQSRRSSRNQPNLTG
jgi:hypothetical protein